MIGISLHILAIIIDNYCLYLAVTFPRSKVLRRTMYSQRKCAVKLLNSSASVGGLLRVYRNEGVEKIITESTFFLKDLRYFRIN